MSASQQLVAGLIKQKDVIKNDPTLAFKLAEETVLPHIDFEGISRWVLGKHWRRATDDQREAFNSAFRDYLVNAYVSAMVTYTDEIISQADHVTYLNGHYSPDAKMATVRSILTLSNGKKIEVKYQMRLTDKGWKAFDLSIGGVSLALTYRADFGNEISNNGIDNLISRLRETK